MARRKALLPVVRERQQLADSLVRMLERLGLERKEKESGVEEFLNWLQARQSAPQGRVYDE